MSRDDIIRMARKAFKDEFSLSIPDLQRFAALVTAHEREQCAKVCDERSQRAFPQSESGLGFSFSQQWDAARESERCCAAAIRARGQT